MNNQTQPPPSGAYYGPPLPQQQRRRFWCQPISFVKGFVAFFVAFGLTVLILWLIFRPHQIKVAVERASLTQFNLNATNPTVLSYNLTTDISIRNPNERIGIYYDWLEADAYFAGSRFGFTGLPTFYQDHKNTTIVHPGFIGSAAFVLDDGGVLDFRTANKTGWFDVEVWLFAQARYRFGSLFTRRYYERVRCGMRLPLLTNGSSSDGFSWTECDVFDY